MSGPCDEEEEAQEGHLEGEGEAAASHSLFWRPNLGQSSIAMVFRERVVSPCTALCSFSLGDCPRRTSLPNFKASLHPL